MRLTTHSLPGRDGFYVGADLYVPDAVGGEPAAAVAGFVLLHGFGGKRAHLAALAARLAAAGCAVLLPDMSSLFSGPREAAQLRNVRAFADHAEWLVAQRGTGGGALVDPARLVLGGHSAGGAVSFEACAELAARGGETRAAACVLLDGVPWPRTMREAAGAFPLQRTVIVSLRAEPSAWNKRAEVLKALAATAAGAAGCNLDERIIDVLIRGSRHADPIASPGTSFFLLRALGLIGPVTANEAFSELIVAIGADARAAGATPLSEVSALTAFGAAVAAMRARGAVEVMSGSALGPTRS